MRIEHIAIWTRNLEEMKVFYETWFQATSGKRYYNPDTQFASYFLSFPSGARLELMHSPGVSRADQHSEALSFGYAHIAFAVDSEQGVDELTAALVGDGHRLVDGPRRTGDGYYESVVLDPEGNRLEITI